MPHTLNASALARACLRPGMTLAALLLLAAPLGAQSHVRIDVAEENLRAEPSGARIAVVNRDFRFAAGETRGQWRAITLDAWVPARFVAVERRDGFNVVLAGAGAALHREPGGEAAGQAMGGVRFTEITRQGGWVRVQRPAWVWSPSVVAATTASPRAAPAPAREAPREAGPAGPAAPPVADSVSAPAAAPRPAQRPLHGRPGGDTIGSLSPATRYEVVGREGEWARVRLEGWVHVGRNGEVPQPGPLRDLSLRALRAEPERYRGVSLQWQLQFMALQRADSVRTDFERGEPYILARDPGGEPGFVYIAVPADQLAAVRRLAPLERVEVVARVRTGRSPLTGHPVLELLELRR